MSGHQVVLLNSKNHRSKGLAIAHLIYYEILIEKLFFKEMSLLCAAVK